MLFRAFSFFVKRVSDAFWGAFSFRARKHCAVPIFAGMITKHRNDHRNMKKKILSGSGDGWGRSIKGFECICSLFS